VIFVSTIVYLPPLNNLLDPSQALAIYDACVIGSAILAAMLATQLWRSSERRETMSKIWGGIAIGLILWAAGEAIGSSDQIWGGESLTILSAVCLFTTAVVVVPIINDTTTFGVFEKVVNPLYPIADFLIALLATALVTLLMGGTLFGSWGHIATGLLCVAGSDLLYTWTLWQGTYQVAPTETVDFTSLTINVLYVMSYVLIALGLFRHYYMTESP